MRFQVREVVPFPPARVFAAERDELNAIVPYLPDVQRVDLRSESRSADGELVQVHRWVGSPRAVPPLIRVLVRPEMLEWQQTTRWSANDRVADWSINVPAFGDAVTAHGTRRYTGSGAQADVDVEGEITVRQGAAGLPAAAIPVVERVVVSLVVPMIARTTVAVGRYLQRAG